MNDTRDAYKATQDDAEGAETPDDGKVAASKFNDAPEASVTRAEDSPKSDDDGGTQAQLDPGD